MSFYTLDKDKLKDRIYDKLKVAYPENFWEYNSSNPVSAIIDTTIELADILNFYTAKATDEIYVETAKRWENIFYAAKSKGYVPKFATPSVGRLKVTFDIPTTLNTSSDTYEIDRDYLPILDVGTVAESKNGMQYTTLQQANFSDFFISSSNFEYEIIFKNDIPFYSISTHVAIVAGTMATYKIAVGNPMPYRRLKLPYKNVTFITNVLDSSGDTWYPVPNLVQDTLYEGVLNTDTTTNESVPYYLQPKFIPKRFTLDNDPYGNVYLQFGSGLEENTLDRDLFPTFQTSYYATQDPDKVTFAHSDIDANAFLQTKTLGYTPQNTTLTITYFYGGGKDTNTIENTITKIKKGKVTRASAVSVDNEKFGQLIQSLQITNPESTVGGSDGDTIKDIKTYSPFFYSARGKAVGLEDIYAIVKNMPSGFGRIDKVHVSKDFYVLKGDSFNNYLNNSDTSSTIDTSQYSKKSNPFSYNIYILSSDSQLKLTQCNQTLKNNLRRYMNDYRMLSDGINILDAFIINIKLTYTIQPKDSQNTYQVLTNTTKMLKNYFDIALWEVGKPINLSDLQNKIYGVDGVLAVTELNIENISGNNYSQFAFPIIKQNNMIYPSIVPSIFEIKYPDSDIIGKTI